MTFRAKIILISVLACTSFGVNEIAFAGPTFYADAGGSAVEFHEPSPFYGANAPNAGLGFGLNYGIWTTFTSNEPALNIQFGLLDRYESASGNNATYGFMAAYPVLRIQLSRLFFSAGATPFVWQSLNYNGNQFSVSRAIGATSYYGDAGILFPVTPKFSFGGSVSVEYVKQDSISSPNPIAAANFFMRFYFGFSDGSHQSSEFHGWRYPFGMN